MIKIIADVPYTAKGLNAKGALTTIGGSEQEQSSLAALLNLRLNKDIEVVKASDATINSSEKYIVYNFTSLNKQAINDLIKYRNYIIVENDFKFSPCRYPDIYPNFVLPKQDLKYLDFYSAARKVLCVSENQMNIFYKNGFSNLDILNTSFWIDEEFQFIQTLIKINDCNIGAIHNLEGPLKGANKAISYCRNNNISFIIIAPCDKKTFLTILSKANNLVFFPDITESFSRVTAEAKMLGLEIIGNDKISFLKESWLGDLSGKDLIDKIQKKLIPIAVDKILNYL